MKNIVVGFLIILPLLLNLSSCSDEKSEQLLDDSSSKTPMTFFASQESLNRSVDFLDNANKLNQFYAVAQVKDEPYLNQFFQRNNDNIFITDPNVFWPDDSREEVTFYALNYEIGANDINYLYNAIHHNNDIVPLSNHSIEYSVENYFYRDLVAAYSVTSVNQTTNGIAPLVFRHILAEVEVYAKTDNLANIYSINAISFESVDNTRIYHFDTNTWSSGNKDQSTRTIDYLSRAKVSINNANDYTEVLEEGYSTGANFRFLIPGDYTLHVDYKDAAGASTTKTCSVTLQQNQKNRINLTLTPPVN